MLAGFEQYIKKTKNRKDNILDQRFVNLKGAYASKCKPYILNSDHNVVHMIPVYKTKLKRSKPKKRTWTNEHKEQLKPFFELTDWDTFQEGSLNETTTVTNDYIDFCLQLVVPTTEIKIFTTINHM
jgi:hypothetical protein